ncbi:hypothetical protein GCM10025868_00850 [Angustibacter aerolatus]|uniref:L-arabinose isomerase central domain-containing protein n=1 Tax=Angustibacter aerolatus TaxID=1162965 RepID=A0ABQ6JDC6_9ACTN|nr:hypothetical protein GCM10025868_00850 [Angustibacter aerolatus]
MLVREYETDYDVEPRLRRGGERHESLRYAARQEPGVAGRLESLGAKAFTTTSRTSAACGACRAWPCSG